MKNVLATFAAAVLLGLAVIAGCQKQPAPNHQTTTTPTTTTAPVSPFPTAKDIVKFNLPTQGKESQNTSLAPNLQQPIVKGKTPYGAPVSNWPGTN